MNELEEQQNTIEDLLLINNGLNLLKEKLKTNALAVNRLKETAEHKNILLESIEASSKRTSLIIQKNINQINAY